MIAARVMRESPPFYKISSEGASKNSFLKNYSKWCVFLGFYFYICIVIDDFLFLYLQHWDK